MASLKRFGNVGRRATRARLEARYKVVLPNGRSMSLFDAVALAKWSGGAPPNRHERRNLQSLQRKLARVAKKAAALEEQRVAEKLHKTGKVTVRIDEH